MFSSPGRRLRLGGKRGRRCRRCRVGLDAANVLFVRRTSCPSPLEADFDTASRLRLGGPAVAYGSAVNEEGGADVAEWASIEVNLLLYDGHLVRREHFARVASVRATLNNQGHRADEGRGNLWTTKHTKHTKSTKVSENEAMDVSFQSSCSSCPSWLLELSVVVNARSGQCDCQLDRVLRADDGQDVRRTLRTSCRLVTSSYNVVGTQKAGSWCPVLVRRTSCPSTLESGRFEPECTLFVA